MGLNSIRIDEFFLDEENDNVRNIRTEEEMLLEIKCLTASRYKSTLSEDGKVLTFRFRDGKTFRLIVQEEKYL